MLQSSYNQSTSSQPNFLQIRSQYPLLICCYSFLPTKLPSISSLKITDRSFRHASPRLWNELPESFRQPNQSPPQFTCSFTCQPILIIISTLRIHHTFTLSLEGQNLPLQQILPTLTLLLYSLDCLQGTEADLSCSSVYFYFFFFYIFCSF